MWALVTYYGGKYQKYLDSNVTHLLALYKDGLKYTEAVKHDIKVVTPTWLLDSIEENKLQLEDDYQPLLSTKEAPPTSIEVPPTFSKPLLTTPPICSETPVTEKDVISPELFIDLTEELVGGAVGGATTTENTYDTKKDSTDQSLMGGEVGGIEGGTSIDSTQMEYSVIQGDQLELYKGPPIFSPISPRDNESIISATPQPTPPRAKGSGGGQSQQKDLLEGVVFCIIDYQELMGTEIIQKWSEVNYLITSYSLIYTWQ